MSNKGFAGLIILMLGSGVAGMAGTTAGLTKSFSLSIGVVMALGIIVAIIGGRIIVKEN